MLALASGWVAARVGLVLLALLVGLALLNRRVRAQSKRADNGVMRLTQQHALHVVEVEGRRLLVGTGPGGAPSLVAELEPASAPVDAPVEQRRRA